MNATDRIKELAVSDSGFLFDPASGATFSVNPSGRVILAELKRGADRTEIIAALAERFDIGEHDLHRDVDGFVHLLRTHALLPEGFSL
ncbi:MAG: HPr-rel-A system PqqD family peptide chaperone [Myxococcales bacterium]|nr:HPr-rel-A system PqqD family peptide chaperone [Myxococcales bacterium]